MVVAALRLPRLLRAAAADGLAFLGVAVTVEANATGDLDITAAVARSKTLVVPAREDVEIARQVRSVLWDFGPW